MQPKNNMLFLMEDHTSKISYAFHTSMTNVIDSSDNEQFSKDIELHEGQDQAHIEFSELPRELWRERTIETTLQNPHKSDQRSRHSWSLNKDLSMLSQ